MQYHGQLKQYLLLVRLPNVFTTPSNILAGYFAVTPVAEANGLHLAALMASSGLLYIAGIILNDYFDIDIDRKERPFRPLPSGSISKRHAIVFAIVSLAVANVLALAVGIISLATSLVLTGVIIAYNYRLKHTIFGPVAMGGSRFLNVILGASPAAAFAIPSMQIALFAATSLFVYVVVITLLAKREVEDNRSYASPVFSTIFALIASIVVVGLLVNLQLSFLINLALFAGVIAITLRSQSVQKTIRNMILSIIILDSIFIAGTAGLPYGLATLTLILPAVVLARKLYVT